MDPKSSPKYDLDDVMRKLVNIEEELGRAETRDVVIAWFIPVSVGAALVAAEIPYFVSAGSRIQWSTLVPNSVMLLVGAFTIIWGFNGIKRKWTVGWGYEENKVRRFGMTTSDSKKDELGAKALGQWIGDLRKELSEVGKKAEGMNNLETELKLKLNTIELETKLVGMYSSVILKSIEGITDIATKS